MPIAPYNDSGNAPAPSAQGKILVIRGGAIGDFVLTLPVLSALRRTFPSAQIEVLGYPHIAKLAVAGGLADAVHSIDARALAGFFARGGSLDRELAAYFASCAIIISFLYDPDGIFQSNVEGVSKAQYLQGPHRPDDKGTIHATECFLQILERLAIFEADPVPRLQMGATGGDLGQGFWLAVHPGSGSETKNWPMDRWRQLLEWIMDKSDWNILVVSGEVEGREPERLVAALPPQRILRAHGLPLPELARRMGQCEAFMGHDSGISHLASALGLRGLVLWGPSKEQVWRPPSLDVKLLKGCEGLASLSVSEVCNALTWLEPVFAA